MASSKLLALALISLIIMVEAAAATSPCPTTPKAAPVKPPSKKKHCPRDTLKLGACADVLGAVSALVGSPPSEKCCAVISGIADLEAALCLCTAIKANVLGINLNIPIAISVLLSACHKNVPEDFTCE